MTDTWETEATPPIARVIGRKKSGRGVKIVGRGCAPGTAVREQEQLRGAYIPGFAVPSLRGAARAPEAGPS